MGRASRRFWLLAALAVAGLCTAGGVALGASVHRAPALSAAQIKAAQAAGPMRVIVLMRNEFRGLPPTAKHMKARVAALTTSQSPLKSSVKLSGGEVTHSFHTFNGFSAAVSPTERSRLAANPNVAAVVPDTVVPNPDPTGAGPFRSAAAGSTTGGPTVGGPRICPANPNTPILAPEGLSMINAPPAQKIVTGAGVKVAFVAEGIDVTNPDFIRPNGSHVIVDYRDFTGEGPNASTTGGEAFGDASTIAAQGNVVYDLSKFSNPLHPIPAHCNIILRGVAPGASLYAMKVFPNGANAFTSTILQGMDWAVSHDHVDVLNESVGGDPITDTDQDVTKQFNTMAEAAGTTVTMSSGDEGISNTIGSPASGPSGIAVGSTTQFQGLAQTTRGAYQLSPHGWENNNIATFSSSGFTQGGKTLDLVAPGNESFEACTPSPQYSDCVNLAGKESNISTFGGTSESAPMTAGVAALVIQAYRQTHGGASPTPALIKQIILSNTDDLNIPSSEQGAGELDALAAVRAAESVNVSSRVGNGLLLSPSQLDLADQAGSQVSSNVTVTNDGSTQQTISASVRTLGTPVPIQKGNVTLNTTTDPTFSDYKGVPQAYTEFHFTVPAGADRLDGSIAWPKPSSIVNMTLFDPQGRMAAYTYQGVGDSSDFGHVDVRNPPGGTWTAVVFTPVTGGFSGSVHLDLSTSSFSSTGSVTPSSVTLAPGASASLHVSLTEPSAAGDYSRDLQVSSSGGTTTVVPIVMRSLIDLSGGQGTYSGTITGGNGNGFPAQENTFAFDVPSGAPGVDVTWTLPADPNTQVIATLTNPDGQAVGEQVSSQNANGVETMHLFKSNPEPGQYVLKFVAPNPVGGTTTSASFSGTVSLNAPTVTATNVPDSAGTQLAQGTPVTVPITVTNTSSTAMNLFVDPRLTQTEVDSLLPIDKATNLKLPLSLSSNPPLFAVPTETSVLDATATATLPITFSWGFDNPELESTTTGTHASGEFSAPNITAGVWFIEPALLGPDTGALSATASAAMGAQLRRFDPAVTSSTGDPQLADIESNPPAARPVKVAPGATVTLTATITPTATPGTVVTGDLFVDDNVPFFGGANELADIPYAYTVASP